MSAQQALKSFENKIGRSINLEATLMKMGSTIMDKDQEIKKHKEQFKKVKGLYSKMIDEMDRWKMTSVDLQRDMDLEHIRYMEEQGRRSDLERENEKLRETIACVVASRLSTWYPDELMEGVDFAEDADMSKVDGDTLIKMIDSYANHCKNKYMEENEKLKKWSLSKDMIESTSAESIEEFERDVRDNWKELVENK